MWFKSAITNSDGGFGFQTVHPCSFVNNQMSLVYSSVIKDNRNNDKIIGVLGAVFNWERFARKVVTTTPLSDDEKTSSRVCVVDDDGLILIDTKEKTLSGKIKFSERDILFSKKKDFTIIENKSGIYCVAHAMSSGYENYFTGWHSLIMQKISNE
jgi:hypothetical protein